MCVKIDRTDIKVSDGSVVAWKTMIKIGDEYFCDCRSKVGSCHLDREPTRPFLQRRGCGRKIWSWVFSSPE